MILWAIVFGALIGWAVDDFDGFGLGVGAVLGLIAGFWLRSALRSELRAASEVMRGEISVALGSRPAVAEPVPVTPIAPDPVAPIVVAEARAAAPITQPWAAPPPPAEILPEPEPAGPNLIERGFGAAKGWLFGGNTIVRVGLVILFVGLSFLARYAASAGMFPVEFRLALIAAVGVGLLVVGFTRRNARPAFALALQGTGVATIYLTVFAAFKMFEIMPVLPAFGLMIVVCALSCALALLQNSQSLAVAAFAGGFAVPVLLSTGGGSSIPLFSYYTMLNLAVLFIAQARAWRYVNLTGFFATFGIATLWGLLMYDPASYATSQAFLIGFVLIYVAAAVLYARNSEPRTDAVGTNRVVDSTLLFGPALAGFGLQVGLVRHLEFGAAFSALGFAALYLVLAAALIRRGRSYRLMTECMLAIGVGFVTLAVPLALGARWTSSVWALEGAGAFWVGSRQARWMPRAFGLLLQVVAAVTFFGSIGENIFALPLANPAFMGAMLVALPALAIAWWLRQPLPHSESGWARAYAEFERGIGSAMFLFGFAFWCLAWILEIDRNIPAAVVGKPIVHAFAESLQMPLTMLAVVVSAWLAAMLGRRTGWRVATWPSRVTLPVLLLTLLGQAGNADHILHTPDWAIWIAATALHYRLLYLNDRDEAVPSLLYRLTHVGSVWLVTLMVADCLWFWIDKAYLWQTSWGGVVALVSSVVVLVALAGWAGRANNGVALTERRWPLNPHAMAYYWIAALPLAGLVFLGTLVTALFASGNTKPLPYIPLFNPIDLTLALALGALVLWRRAVIRAEPSPGGSAWLQGRNALGATAGLAFIAINTVWLRTAHHYLGVAWNPDALLDSFAVQTGLSILWTLLALGLMLFAHARARRATWLTGAVLLTLVVAKLMLVDQSNAGGGERIVTFIVVGLLMLVVGYFAPLPPRLATAEDVPA